MPFCILPGWGTPSGRQTLGQSVSALANGKKVGALGVTFKKFDSRKCRAHLPTGGAYVLATKCRREPL